MKTTILEKAKAIVERRRSISEETALRNKQLAFKDKIFKELYQSYTTKMIECARQDKPLSEEDKNLKVRYLERLKELNIRSIEPYYYCHKCKDTGFIQGKYCTCLIKEINNLLKQESGFLSFEDFKDAKFDFSDKAEFYKQLYQLMKAWCHSSFQKNLILLAGDTGVGKTHLIKCMANELIKLNHVVLFTSSFAMHQDFYKSYATKDLDQKNALLERYLNCEFLFIDDLGTELRNPNISLNYLYQVINERKNKKLPTIITTNLDLYDIKDYYDERISSRIIDKNTSICILIKGKDIRLQK